MQKLPLYKWVQKNINQQNKENSILNLKIFY